MIDIEKVLEVIESELKMINGDCMVDNQLKPEYIEYKMKCIKERLK